LLGKINRAPRTYASSFYYPRRGIGQIAESISSIIEKHSGKVHLNSFVKKINLNKGEVKEIIYQEGGKEKVLSGDFFISTLPLNEFLKSITPAIDAEYLAIAESMKFRSVRFLNLMLNASQISDNTWIYVPEEKFLFFRIQEPKNWNPYNVPEGKTSLTLEIACNEGDSIWNASEEDIYAQCARDLKQLGLIDGVDIEGYFTVKEKYCYPVYELDYKKKINKDIHFLAGIENLLSIGRQGLFRYNNMDHSLKMGFLSAKHVLGGLPKEEVMKVATEQKLFE
jgi:protoporphyrinogen oxidase